MKKYVTLLLFITLSYTGFAQNWVSVNNNPLTKSGRTRNKGFSINGTGYVLGGSDANNYYGSEAWAYDTATKSWSAIQPYPDATGDDGKSTVAVDSLAYSGLGGTSGFAWTDSWYSYSKTLDQWTPLNFYPGSARAYAATFAIGGEIYVAGGMNGSTPATGHNDFYKYDIASDSWRQLANCPDSGVNFSAVAFTLGGKGYICTGASVNNSTGAMTALNEVWEYDPSDSSWTKKDPFPGGPRTEAMGWATCDKGYVGGGYAVHSPQTLDSDFWEYDPTIDTWTQIANYGGGNLNGAATFVIGKTGYVCGGQRDSANYQQARGYVWTNDDWSYTKVYTPTFSVSPSAAICAGQSITFTDTSNYSPENWYWQFPGGIPDTSTLKSPTIEYDATGNYTVILTARNSCDSGTQTYTNYVTVGVGGALTVLPKSKTVCSGQSVTLIVNDTGTNFTWNPSTGLSSTTGDTVIATPTDTTIYTVTKSGAAGCLSIGYDTISIVAAPPLIITPQSPKICNGQGVTLSVPVSGKEYTWSPAAMLNASTGDSVVAIPSVTATYSVTGTDSVGCVATGTDSVYIIPALPLTILPQPPPLFCSGSSAELKVKGGGTDFTWSPSTSLSASTGDSVLANPTATTTYTIMGNDSLGCASSGTEKVTVFPAPITPTFTQLGDSLKSSAQYQNQWYLNGEPLTGDTSQYLVITVGGEYKVSVTNEANGCSSASDSASITTGINQLSAISDQLSIYPNPFNNTIVIKINSSAVDIKDWNLQIIDVLGRTVYSQSLLNYSNDIDLSNLAAGVYFITVINKTGRAVVPVMKQ